MKKLIVAFLALFVISASAVYAVQRVSILPLTIQIKSSTTAITSAAKVPAIALAGRESVAIFNVTNATETLWCGGSDVTSANGFPLTNSNPAISIDLDGSVDIYCVSDGTSVDVRSLEVK